MRELQARETKARLLKCTREMLKTKRIEELKIKDICEMAKVSVGAFYHHFPNKAQIIVELYKEVDEEFSKNIYPKFCNQEPVLAILGYLKAQCSYGVKMGNDMIRNIYKAQVDMGNQFFLSTDRGLPHHLLLLVRRAVDCGRLAKNKDADQITNDLLIITRGIIYHWCVNEGTSDMAALVVRIAGGYLESCMEKGTGAIASAASYGPDQK